jgi:hypothetical protein
MREGVARRVVDVEDRDLDPVAPPAPRAARSGPRPGGVDDRARQRRRLGEPPDRDERQERETGHGPELHQGACHERRRRGLLGPARSRRLIRWPQPGAVTQWQGSPESGGRSPDSGHGPLSRPDATARADRRPRAALGQPDRRRRHPGAAAAQPASPAGRQRQRRRSGGRRSPRVATALRARADRERRGAARPRLDQRHPGRRRRDPRGPAGARRGRGDRRQPAVRRVRRADPGAGCGSAARPRRRRRWPRCSRCSTSWRRLGGHDPPRRRDRHRQGPPGPRGPRGQPARRWAAGGVRLRRGHRVAHRERAVRAREGRVHRRGRRAGRGLRASRRWHPVPRRAGRAASRAAAAPPARPRAARGPAGRRLGRAGGRRASDRGDQPRSGGRGRGRPVPSRSVLPGHGRGGRGATAARPARGSAAPGRRPPRGASPRHAGGDGGPGGLRLAGQRPRAAQRRDHRAGHARRPGPRRPPPDVPGGAAPRRARARPRPRRDPADLDELPLAGQSLEAIERAAIKQTLEREGGNRTRTARALGIAQSTLYEKLKRYGL